METTNVAKKRNVRVILILGAILVALLLVVVFNFVGSKSTGKVLTHTLTESLGDATSVKFDFNTGTGNISVDRLPAGESLLASGTLEYLEGQDQPVRSLEMNNGLLTFKLEAKGGQQAGFHLPWKALNGETNWRIHLNPTVSSEINAISGGGNVNISLVGLIVTRLTTETGGGNVDVMLPDGAANLTVSAKTGGGRVTVEFGNGATGSNFLTATSGGGDVVIRLPEGIAARVHADTGMGKVTIDPRLTKIDDHTYESPDYTYATNKVEITAESGAGDVTVVTK